MAEQAAIAAELRDKILSEPDVILGDQDLMRALVSANERAMGGNVVDLRGIAMDRLEARLERLEDTHRGVIAAAYDNLAGTNQIHRAVLQILEPIQFELFLRSLETEISEILRLDAIRLVLESHSSGNDATVGRFGGVLHVAETGFVQSYLSDGNRRAPRDVVLRQVDPEPNSLYGEAAGWIRSEACLRLDLGAGRLPAMLAMGAEDPHQFKPAMGTDLLDFFGRVFERVMRRYLS